MGVFTYQYKANREIQQTVLEVWIYDRLNPRPPKEGVATPTIFNNIFIWQPEVAKRLYVAKNYTEKFGTLKLTLKNDIKGGSTEYHTIPCLCYVGMQKEKQKEKKVNLPYFLSKLNTVSNFKPFIKYIECLIIALKT